MHTRWSLLSGGVFAAAIAVFACGGPAPESERILDDLIARVASPPMEVPSSAVRTIELEPRAHWRAVVRLPIGEVPLEIIREPDQHRIVLGPACAPLFEQVTGASGTLVQLEIGLDNALDWAARLDQTRTDRALNACAETRGWRCYLEALEAFVLGAGAEPGIARQMELDRVRLGLEELKAFLPDELGPQLALLAGRASALSAAIPGLVEGSAIQPAAGLRIGPPRGYLEGDYGAFGGAIAKRAGRGDLLVLASPIHVGGEKIDALVLDHILDFEPGMKAVFFGRLRLRWEGTGDFERYPYELEGVSNLSAGEPRFTGERFFDAKDQPLVSLRWAAWPNTFDSPSMIAVRDPALRTAFLGLFGGYMTWADPFAGFFDRAPIEPPRYSDCVGLGVDDDGVPFGPQGAMELVGVDADPPWMIDGMVHEWWLDRALDRILRLDTGGIAGFENTPMEVIHLPK
jgi:hypothetical protein